MTAARGQHFGLPVANRFAFSRQHKDDFAIACVLVHTYRRVRFEPARNKFYVRLIEHFKPSRAFSVAKAIGAFFAYSFKIDFNMLFLIISFSGGISPAVLAKLSFDRNVNSEFPNNNN